MREKSSVISQMNTIYKNYKQMRKVIEEYLIGITASLFIDFPIKIIVISSERAVSPSWRTPTKMLLKITSCQPLEVLLKIIHQHVKTSTL